MCDSKWVIGALQLVDRREFTVLDTAEGNSPLAALIHLTGITLRQASLNEKQKVARSDSQIFFQVSKVLQKRGEKADKKAQIFLDFSQRVNEDLASSTVIYKLQREARSYFECEHCLLHILSEDKRELVTQVDSSSENCKALRHPPFSSSFLSSIFVAFLRHSVGLAQITKIPIGVGLVGHVAQTGEPILTNSAFTHPLFRPEFDKLINEEAKSVICAPIRHKGTILGVLQLIHKHDGEFTETDQKDFEAFIVLCTIALHNAMLYEKESRERLKISTLLDIVTDLYRHLDVNHIMQRVMRSATAYLDAERFSLFLLDNEKNELFAKVLKVGETDSIRGTLAPFPPWLVTRSIIIPFPAHSGRNPAPP